MSRITTLSLSWFFIVTLAIAISASPRTATAGDLDEFAKCIAESGAIFYGAHFMASIVRQNTKFGDSAHLLPYKECYEPDSRKKLDECAHLEMFPTWVFPDGTARNGSQSVEDLAALTGCPLP